MPDIPPEIDVAFIDEFDANAEALGAKGIGEVGATGVAAAVDNAVYDAIGVRIRDLPVTPAKILQAIVREKLLLRAQGGGPRAQGDNQSKG